MIIDMNRYKKDKIYECENIRKIEEAKWYLIDKGLNPDAYNDVVKVAKGFKIMEKLEKKYGVKF